MMNSKEESEKAFSYLNDQLIRIAKIKDKKEWKREYLALKKFLELYYFNAYSDGYKRGSSDAEETILENVFQN